MSVTCGCPRWSMTKAQWVRTLWVTKDLPKPGELYDSVYKGQ